MKINKNLRRKLIKKFPFLTRLSRVWRDGTSVKIKSGRLKGYRWVRRKTQVNGYWRGDYEDHVQKCLAQIIKKGNVVYDIGANSGFHTLLCSVLTGHEGEVIAAEPFPDFVKEIEEAVRENDIHNVAICAKAISDENGVVKFSSQLDSRQTIVADDEVGLTTIDVPAITLDGMLQDYPKPDVVLMDIECFEGRVISKSSEMVQECRPVFLIETHHREIEEGLVNANLLKEKFFSCGYRFFSMSFSVVKLQAGDVSQVLPNHVLAIPDEKISNYVNG